MTFFFFLNSSAMSKNYFLNWKQWKKSKFGCKGKQEFGFYVEVPNTVPHTYFSSAQFD